MPKRISISIDDEQLAILKTIKGLGKKDAGIVKNIVVSFLSEKGYIDRFNRKVRNKRR